MSIDLIKDDNTFKFDKIINEGLSNQQEKCSIWIRKLILKETMNNLCYIHCNIMKNQKLNNLTNIQNKKLILKITNT